FRNGPPQLLTDGAMYSIEGCATISDRFGNLLFYTDGITVYGKNHVQMPEGYGLFGHPSATQAGVIVPIPNDTLKYLIFSVDEEMKVNGLSYSLVDLSLNNGYGDIKTGYKNINLIPVSTERITAINHKNNFGIWVIVHEWENNRFRSYLVTDQGINPSDYVVSSVGINHDGHVDNGKGYLKVSTAGEKVAVAIQGMNLVQVFDFDNETGILTNPVSLPDIDNPYGVEFCPENRFLYASERKKRDIHQWDLWAGDENAIQNSRTVVGVLGYAGGGALQLAPDGKIYIARKSKKYLSVINVPSMQGSACGFADQGLSLGEMASKEGLPTFIQSFFNFYYFEYENTCHGDTTFFYLNKTSFLDSAQWNFGDPVSPVNLSNNFEAEHVFSAPGTYDVLLRLFHLGSFTDLHKSIEIIALPDTELGEDKSICEGDTTLLDAGPGFLNYMWNDNPGLQDPYLLVNEEGNYWIEVKNQCGIDWDTAYVTVNPLPEVDLGEDTTIRYETYITLNAGPGLEEYTWQDGTSSSMYITEEPGLFWVEVANEFTCKASDTILIEPVPFQLNLPQAFTPNGDSRNDIFRAIPTYNVEIDFQMMIFNRSGEQVFQSNNISNGWDGTFRNLPCEMDVYIWIVDAETLQDNPFFTGPLKSFGSVTLLR
ncbi:MAG: gliding motility-associated C-terminal domain-containing protein, partial [Bacteroidales bacterium]|nr:gliding motility-associated C-terminal domain-containing protein [Bacteroidales bacterium]